MNKATEIQESHSMSGATPQKESLPSALQATALNNLLRDLRVRKRRPGSVLSANIADALKTFASRGTRAFLTILSIFIGITAVIVAIIWTQGLSASLVNQLVSLGTNVISVTANQGGNGGITAGRPLIPSDVQSLQTLPHIVAVSPIVTLSSVQVVYGHQNWNTTTEGVSQEFQSMQDWQLAQGAWFNSDQDARGVSVAVLGDTVAHQLFTNSGSNPLGQQIRIGTQIFRVVGILASKGGGASQDDVIFIPFHTALTRLRNTNVVDLIEVQVDAMDSIDQAQQAIATRLRQNHGITKDMSDDFTIVTANDLIQSTQQQTQLMTALSVGIAAISLTVAGIGIMNTMFVAVTERTREIGIRMSVGARQRDIRDQFLIETLVVCLAGGLVGLLFGLLIGWGVTYVNGLPLVVTVMTLLLPFAISTCLAFIFGLYPAIRASRLDPIKAIRSTL